MFRHYSYFLYVIIFFLKYMKVKIFDEESEYDLERDINEFITDDIEVMDIQFQTSISIFGSEQIYCFSALIIYH